MNSFIQRFSDWLSATSMSETIQDVTWIIPTVQTIHILSIAIVMSSVLLIHLRVFGVMGRDQPLDTISARFLPWIWLTLIVLLLSGSTLIIGEPGRSLQNPAFVAKMLMLLTVIALTVFFQAGLRRDPDFWNRSVGRRLGVRVISATSLVLWIAIVFAGRWIAYMVKADGAN